MNLVDRYKKTIHYALAKKRPKTLRGLIKLADDYGYKVEITEHKETYPEGTVDVAQALGYEYHSLLASTGKNCT